MHVKCPVLTLLRFDLWRTLQCQQYLVLYGMEWFNYWGDDMKSIREGFDQSLLSRRIKGCQLAGVIIGNREGHLSSVAGSTLSRDLRFFFASLLRRHILVTLSDTWQQERSSARETPRKSMTQKISNRSDGKANGDNLLRLTGNTANGLASYWCGSQQWQVLWNPQDLVAESSDDARENRQAKACCNTTMRVRVPVTKPEAFNIPVHPTWHHLTKLWSATSRTHYVVSDFRLKKHSRRLSDAIRKAAM